ncbi:uridine kinase [Streptomyces sp. NPDC050610]|uniref:uridine kinase n=1 Tax=Streptomyces sp. NPDC050610 TaxID=3157097 RepID=UPI00343D0FF9
MWWEAISWTRLTQALVERIATAEAEDGSPWLRVAVDGAPAARPAELARGMAEELRARGRPVAVIGTGGFLRAASLRFEYGRQDADAYYDLWLDAGALHREVFAPLEPGGSGRVLPDLRDPVTDRATRSPYLTVPPGGVVIVHGPLLLGHWFPFDLAVHLRMSPAALARHTDEAEAWTVPAFARYADEVRPEDAAQVVVRADDPRRPAWSGFTAGA